MTLIDVIAEISSLVMSSMVTSTFSATTSFLLHPASCSQLFAQQLDYPLLSVSYVYLHDEQSQRLSSTNDVHLHSFDLCQRAVSCFGALGIIPRWCGPDEVSLQLLQYQ